MKKQLLFSLLLALFSIIQAQAQTNLATSVSAKAASYTASWNSINGLNDNSMAASATNIWACWQTTRTATNWVSYQWATAQNINKVTVYFTPDNLSTTGWGDNVPVPESWKVQYSNDGTTWTDVTLVSGQNYTKYFVASNATTFANSLPNTVQFEAISATYLRLYMNMQSNGTTYAATCIGEWQVFGGTDDATLSSLKIRGLNIGGFAPGTINYTYNVPAGVSLADLQITATTSDANATTVITQASAFGNAATVAVTAPDGTTTKTYTINYTAQNSNYMYGWDAGGSAATIPANTAGWGVSGRTPVWQGVVPSSTNDNYRDFTTAPVTGAKTGRALYALGGVGVYFSYPVKLQGGKYYNFSCTNWSRNGTNDNVTYSIYSNATGIGGITYGSQTQNFAANIGKDYSFNFAIPADGIYYLLRNSTQSGIIEATWAPTMTQTGDAGTVTFNTDGGSTVATQYFVPGVSYTVTQPANPTKTNYAFADWYTDATYTTLFNFATAVTGNTTVYAKFTTDPVLQVSNASSSFTTYDPIKTFTVTGTYLTADLTITAPAGVTLTGANVTGTAPNYSIALANANTTNTITATWDGATALSAQNIVLATTGATTRNIVLTGDATAQFIPTAGQSYYLIQGPTALANANKVVGNNSGPALVSAQNNNTQQFTFEAVPSTTNQYYIKNGAGDYLNYTSGTSLVYGALNGNSSIWFIKGTTTSGLRLINKQAYSYLNSAAVISGSALTVGGTSAATNGAYTLVLSSALYQNSLIDGGFEYAATDGTPMGEWVSSPAMQIGVSGYSRIRNGATYISAGNYSFMLRLMGDANSYNLISNTLNDLTVGHTYKLDFKYKTANATSDATVAATGSVVNVYASNTQNGDLTTALGGNTNYVSTPTPTLALSGQPATGNVGSSLTFVPTQANCYLVFAKNDNAILFNFYIDDLKLTDVTVATFDKTATSNIVLFKNNAGMTISGLTTGDKVGIYSVNGQLVKSTVATSDNLNVALSHGVYLVKVNASVKKVTL